MKITVDGNTAAARIAYKLSEIAEIYPITPSSAMAEYCSSLSSENEKNIFGKTVEIKELQSEAGAVGTLHGSLTCGALSTTFTASQGLLLMIPNMYKIAGELLPCVFHVSARALATHALSIFVDHSDVMACKSTGFAFICSSNVQECQDMALASHIATLESSVPFLHFFDGFRTSHEIQKIDSISDEDIKKIYPYEKLKEFKNRALDPLNPRQQGTAQNPDIFFQNREACNKHYDNVFDCVCSSFDKIEKITKRKYAPFEYYGCKNPKYLIISMGSSTETIIKTINDLNNNGESVGMIRVRLYRPFNYTYLSNLIPKSVKKIAVLDRTKDPSAPSEPLYQDVAFALLKTNRKIECYGGRYGLGGKEFLPKHVFSILENLKLEQPIDNFTVGINDDISLKSLKDYNYTLNNIDKEYKFFGLGSDGTVSANKSTIKIIGDSTNMNVQAYFEYDSKKSGSLTTSHLRISDNVIQSPYTLENPDLISIHNFSFVQRYDLISNLKNNGVVILNTTHTEENLQQYLPKEFINNLKEKNAKLYIINAQKIAQDCNLGNKINIIMQIAFFKASNIINFEIAKEKIKQNIIKTFSKKGENVIKNNLNALEIAENSLISVNFSDWNSNLDYLKKSSTDAYYKEFIEPIENLKGSELPVSTFNPSGFVPTDTSKHLKRGIASHLPCWNSENCIQCGQCVLACPHSVIKTKLIDEENLKNCPDDFKTANAIGVKGAKFKLQISPLDCTGCGVCEKVCPSRNKAVTMKNTSEILEKEQKNYEFFKNLPDFNNPFSKIAPKGLQFEKCYFEFSGACPGCGETPYIKLASTLFGKNMVIANATGCSSIYGGNSPVCPYSKDKNGFGPAWANSLFEDNAEFGLGMSLAIENNKKMLEIYVKEYLDICKNTHIVTILNEWLENKFISDDKYLQLNTLLEKEQPNTILDNINLYKKYFTKKSVWIIGGDGWAYDIGFGGLDHLFSLKQNVNILILDSEVYSNTGGQASKSTQKGATAKFAPAGKQSKKKDLGLIAMTYKNCYVAQVSLGANQAQCIKAFKEAEEFDGVSIIIAYSPCVNHGIDMSESHTEMRRAVESGYWNLYRFNPNNEKPLELDSKEPTLNYRDFLLGEARYKALFKANPEQAEILLNQNEQEAKERRKMLEMIYNNQ